MTIPKAHNDYDRLKRQLGDDAVRRVGKLIAEVQDGGGWV